MTTVWAVYQAGGSLLSLHDSRRGALHKIWRLRYQEAEDCRDHYIRKGREDAYIYGYDYEGPLFEPLRYEVKELNVEQG
jgi:hypothetical protein